MPPATGERPAVLLRTAEGTVTIELWPGYAPATVSNFLAYVDAGFYDGLIFHRVIKGFVIQGGAFTTRLRHREARGPILNEARSDVPCVRGTIAMARTELVHSATSQFFINLADNPELDHAGETPDTFGYCVFGAVTDGMAVLDAIARKGTTTARGMRNVPEEPIEIKEMRRIEAN